MIELLAAPQRALLSPNVCVCVCGVMVGNGSDCCTNVWPQEFMDVAMGMDPALKMCTGGRMEKDVLRRAFDTPSVRPRPLVP